MYRSQRAAVRRDHDAMTYDINDFALPEGDFVTRGDLV